MCVYNYTVSFVCYLIMLLCTLKGPGLSDSTKQKPRDTWTCINSLNSQTEKTYFDKNVRIYYWKKVFFFIRLSLLNGIFFTLWLIMNK